MLLLHISDIHFHHPICSTSMDPDRPYRTHLIQDARQRVNSLGQSVDAILVGGDVAFQGAPAEYDAAFVWLQELAAATGCSMERIFVVPGNHDVDRRISTNNASVRNVQHMIGSAPANRRERELFGQLQDAEAGRAIFAPIAAYNEFAAKFNCQVFAPERPFWHQDLPLDSQTVLRIFGLTSTFLSGADGRDNAPGLLYLSPLQTVLDPVDGVVNLAMCHHPPDWFLDSDDVDDALRGRASIHLFGHKHRQRFYKDDSYVRFSAGAVNPDRNELGWQPGYNLISLSIVSDSGMRHLAVEAHLLAWQVMPPMFRPIAISQNDIVFRHRVPVRGIFAPLPHTRVVTSHSTTESASSPISQAVALEEAEDVEGAMSDERMRNLVLRFWNLTASQRREISLRLELIDATEMHLPEPERYGRALIRAGERGLLTRVAEEVEQLEAH